jgi:hypothetical protein
MPRELASLRSATLILDTSSFGAGEAAFRIVHVDIAVGICAVEASGPKYSPPLYGFSNSIP